MFIFCFIRMKDRVDFAIIHSEPLSFLLTIYSTKLRKVHRQICILAICAAAVDTIWFVYLNLPACSKDVDVVYNGYLFPFVCLFAVCL